MVELLTSQFGAWIGIGTVVVVGIFAFIGLFDKRKRELRNEENGTEDRVIKLLKTEIEELSKKVTKLEAREVVMTAELEKLKNENHTLVTVLQGRDAATQKFQQDAYMAMGQIGEMVHTTKQLAESVTKLATLMDGFMKAGSNK